MGTKTTLMDFVYDQTIKILDLDANSQAVLPLYSPESPAGLEDNHTDIIFYNIQPYDDGINKQIDVVGGTITDGYISQSVSYVRTWEIEWQIYGDSSFDNADKIRLALYNDSNINDDFEGLGLSIIPSIQAPVYVPEDINNQWFQRYDLRVKINELVTVQGQAPIINNAQIEIVTEDGRITSA